LSRNAQARLVGGEIPLQREAAVVDRLRPFADESKDFTGRRAVNVSQLLVSHHRRTLDRRAEEAVV
jgi:hypothetical protein